MDPRPSYRAWKPCTDRCERARGQVRCVAGRLAAFGSIRCSRLTAVDQMRFFRKILNRLFRDALSRDIATVASGNAAAQILQLIAVPVLMLLYEPSDYGVYAVYLAAVAVLAVVSSLRYDFAILLATSRRTIFSLFALCTGMVVGWCALLALLGTGATLVYAADPWPALPLRLALFLPLGVGLNAFHTLSLQYATRQQEYGTLRTARILYGFVTVLAQGVLFFLYDSPVGLILGEALGRAAGVLVLTRPVFVDWRSCRARVSIRNVAAAARRYSRFPRYLVVMDFLSAIARNAPVTLRDLLWNFRSRRLRTSAAPLRRTFDVAGSSCRSGVRRPPVLRTPKEG